MRYTAVSCTLAILWQEASAFPSITDELLSRASRLSTRATAPQGGAPDPLSEAIGFDASKQYVNTTGAHAFVAPGLNDQRGPCPGLNAMANHGYFPHNGVGQINDFITGTYEAFGMGVDLSTLLAIYGAVFDGDLTSYSIGGPTPNLVSNIITGLGLLGEPQGLSGSHNKYEGDVSPTRGDLYQYGNDYKLQLKQFTELYELGMADDNYDLELLTNYRVTRFQQSVSENPYFFNAPFSGVVASPAAWSFIYRFMANKSEEYPQGQLNGENLKSFYGITGDYPNFTYTPGNERIPENWYTRARGAEYTIPFLAQDALLQAVEHPEFLSIGGNTGTVNSFTGVDIENLTSGVFNAATLLEGNNSLCFALQLTLMETPDLLEGLLDDVGKAVGVLASAIGSVTGSLGCPELQEVDSSQFAQFPGFTKLKADGSY